ncbi:hypothetical protein DMP23_32925 [Amycolatopsis sp. A1MSW2902]|uniref:hypothetical protein n=1 Tax=Amycolatopsis sp. A1MSW2902 TaxID=687413 RepID=UPI00307EA8DA
MNDEKNPSPGEPAGQEPTEQFGRTGDLGGASADAGPAAAGGQAGSAGDATQPSQPVPSAEQTSQLGQPGPSAEQGASSAEAGQHAGPAAQQPNQQPNQPGQFAQPGPWGMPLPPPKQSGFRRFVAHRATQLVAVSVLGLVVGGGIVGGVMAATHHPGRPGMSQHQGGHRFNDGGPGQRHRVPDGQNGGSGNNGNNGPGFGNGGGTGSGTGN